MTKIRRGAMPKSGDVFNSWTLLETPRILDQKALCRCHCGREYLVGMQNLIRGQSKNCRACADRNAHRTHGDSDRSGIRPGHRLYRIWKAMKWRCNPNNQGDRPDYHDRGIAVCAEWAGSYEVFREWAFANGYQDRLTIDRRDNDRGYSPANCRWIGYVPQARNRRSNRLVTAFGESKSIVEWAEDARCPVNQKTLSKRLILGWDEQDAVATPLRSRIKAA